MCATAFGGCGHCSKTSHIAAYIDGGLLPSKLRIAGVASLFWLAFDIARHETNEKGTSRHRLDPSISAMHYKGANVTLDIAIGEGCWNAEHTAIPKSRPTFQAHGDFAGGAEGPYRMIAVTPISPDVLAAAKGIIFLDYIFIVDTVESPLPFSRSFHVAMFSFF